MINDDLKEEKKSKIIEISIIEINNRAFYEIGKVGKEMLFGKNG